MRRNLRMTTKEQQKTITERYKKWHKAHPTEQARRIDKINGIPLPGLKYYYATKSGFIISFARNKPRVLTFEMDTQKRGYARVQIQQEGIDKNNNKFRVHRLILETFESEVDYFPSKTDTTDIFDYVGHHKQNKYIDVVANKSILAGKSQAEIDRYKEFYDNSLDNLQYILNIQRVNQVHDDLHNQIWCNLDPGNGFDDLKTISNFCKDHNIDKPCLIFSGKYIDKNTNEVFTDGKQEAIELSQEDIEKLFSKLTSQPMQLYVMSNSVNC